MRLKMMWKFVPQVVKKKNESGEVSNGPKLR